MIALHLQANPTVNGDERSVYVVVSDTGMPMAAFLTADEACRWGVSAGDDVYQSITVPVSVGLYNEWAKSPLTKSGEWTYKRFTRKPLIPVQND